MPPRVNADEKRREVVAGAAELFDRAGYHTTTMAQVADAAGLAKPTLYHYFRSKDAILLRIHEEFIDLLLERQRARAGLPADAALLEAMSDILGLMDTHRGHVRVFFEHYRELPPSDQDAIRAKRGAYYAAVEQLVVRGVREGAFRPLDPALVTLALFGVCNWAYQWYRSGGPRTSREIAELFFDLVTNGLRR